MDVHRRVFVLANVASVGKRKGWCSSCLAPLGRVTWGGGFGMLWGSLIPVID